ncbi:hypothetical protein OQA88_10460 [Cercophora sp. LCS_1]
MADPTPSIPKGSLILVTGVTGHLASELARQFLERGYRVRGTVRDLSRASWLGVEGNNVFSPYAASGQLELVVVPDMAAPGAFSDPALFQGVSAVAHVATMGFDPDPSKVIPAAVSSTTSILCAAAAAPTVHRFVFTSSVVAAAALTPGNTHEVTQASWNEAALDMAWAPPPYDPERIIPVYMASKVAAEREVWRFVSDERPPFVLNVVSPQVVWGQRLSPRCAAPSASMVPELFEGKLQNTAMMPAVYAVDVKDVGLLHVAAVLDSDTRSKRILAWGRYHTWPETLAVFRKLYPARRFVSDDQFVGLPGLTLTTDESVPLGLMEKWGGQVGWRLLEDTVRDNLDYVK